MAAKKKAARKMPRKAKPAKKAKRVSSKSRKPKAAGTIEIVKPPMIDVTQEVKKDVVEVKPEAPKVEQPQAQPVEKPEAFAQSLTQEPAKKPGFWARLFGKKQ